MNVDQVLQIFRDPDQNPREAVQWGLDHWQEVSDRFLSRLRTIAANLADSPDDDEFDDSDGLTLFYLVHLFAEKRDKRAYAPLCQRLLRDRHSQAWLGDAVGESLAGVLIVLQDGDLEPIQRIVENAECDEYVRGAALDAYGYLARFDLALGDDEARRYLRHLYEQAEPRGPSWLWAAWADTVARLGFSDLAPDVARLYSKSWIDDSISTIQEFHGLLAKGRSHPETIFSDDRVAPFNSILELLGRFEPTRGYGAEESSGDHDYDLGSFGAPYVNPNRDVGRNDPCPCGSGKKYKKCCLAA
jgi:uncharacterized protein